MKSFLSRPSSVVAMLLLLAFVPRASFADFNFINTLDIKTNYPGITYNLAKAQLLSVLPGGARWGIVGATLATNLSGAKYCNNGAYCADGTYVIEYTTQTNYYVPDPQSILLNKDTNLIYYYVPYSNTLSVTVSGPPAPVEWTLTGPAAFANSSAYRTSGSNSMDLVPVPVGTYTVTFPKVRGFAAPPILTTNVSGASPLTNMLALDYAVYSNSLAVTVVGITSGSNAVWTLTGPAEFTNVVSYGTTFTNSFTMTGIPTGIYIVTFPAIVGYTAPTNASTDITSASPLIIGLTGTYASVIWGTNTSTNTPATNFPAYTNAITLMVDSNGLFKTPSREKIIAANGLLTNGAGGSAGPAGAQGIPGSNGVDGATGPQGPAGTNGAVGPQGIQGPAGTNGAVGPQGPAGSNGLDGATGPQGPAGTNGVSGTNGAPGEAGPQGPAGSNGVDGATGPQGPAGTNGAVGPQGPAGSNGVLSISFTGAVTGAITFSGAGVTQTNNDFNFSGGGSGGGLQSGASYTNLTGLTAITFESSTSLVVDAMSQNQIVMALTNNIVMAAPTNAIDGRKIEWRFKATTSDRTVTWPTPAFRIPSSSSMSNVVTVTNGSTSIFVIEFNAASTNWMLETYVWGY